MQTARLLAAACAIVLGGVALRISAGAAAGIAPERVATEATQSGEQAQEHRKPENATRSNPAGGKSTTKLMLQPGRLVPPTGGGRTVVSYPLEFTAGEGETIGTIRGTVLLPRSESGEDWKFLKAVLPPGSRLKISVQERKTKDRAKGAAEAIELNISGGARAIRNGVVAELHFAVPGTVKPGDVMAIPVITLLSTSPPQTEQVREPADKPFDLSPAPPVNPGVSCFFFSH